MISSAVSTIRCTAAIRYGKAYGRQSIRALSASSPDKSNASGEASSTPPSSGSDIKVDASPDKADEEWKKPFSLGQIFGSYLQVGVWVVVLSAAGYSGFQQAQTSPESVGILLAPPGAALFLMASFVLYRVLTNEKYDD